MLARVSLNSHSGGKRSHLIAIPVRQGNWFLDLFVVLGSVCNLMFQQSLAASSLTLRLGLRGFLEKRLV